ncbi:hypothetical protein [Leucobacter denitrificans]|uniref:Uncharacterized protein n=1 Tax=Leucobacter denitrificans TaxID=683042 RepID=A0A7G9S449_9MICO|nr:hypothetical protein [Leucobacter denitrificans]QNN62624.1 hypothetical protein H9L06_10365 [Leucobacter denitrificans]
MMHIRWLVRVVVLLGAAMVALGMAACAEKVDVKMSVADAGGLTRGEVEEMSLHEQFDLFGERQARIEQLLTEAQLQVSSESWTWSGQMLIPSSGQTALNQLPGATAENSYYLSMARYIHVPGATGGREDIEPIIDYFESQGWDVSLNEVSTDHLIARADTGDGYMLEYWVQASGQYNMIARSYLFWGDYRGLLYAIADRVPDEKLGVSESVPGVFTPFPKWSDPVIEDDPYADL